MNDREAALARADLMLAEQEYADVRVAHKNGEADFVDVKRAQLKLRQAVHAFNSAIASRCPECNQILPEGQ